MRGHACYDQFFVERIPNISVPNQEVRNHLVQISTGHNNYDLVKWLISILPIGRYDGGVVLQHRRMDSTTNQRRPGGRQIRVYLGVSDP